MYKVLIVDDEPYMHEGLKKLIPWEEYGLEICGVAFNGKEATAIIESTCVHIMITDMKMPVMDGVKLLEYVRQRNPDIKCIVLSGFDEFHYVKTASLLGIENYFLKPVNGEELSGTLLNTVRKIQNECRLKLKERQNSDVLRNNLVLLWLNNVISTRELLEKKDVVIFDLESSHYLVAIIKIMNSDEEDKNLLSFAVNNIFCELMNEKNIGLSFCDINGDLILVFRSMEIDINPQTVYSFLVFAMDVVKRNLGVDLFAAVGNVVSNGEAVSSSYQQAQRLMSHHIIFQNKRIVMHNDSLNYADSPFLDENSENLRALTNTLDKKGLILYVYDLCLKLESNKASLADSQAAMTKFITEFLTELKIMNIDTEQFIKECGSIFKYVFNAESIDKMLEGLLQIVDRVISLAERQFASRNIYVNKAIDYINNNYQKGLSLKIISAEINISPQYLGQMFIKETGETFTNYLNNYRIKKAKELLIHSTLKMHEISQKIGFDNTNYFYTVFKKSCGMSPNEFRELNFHLGK